MKRFLSILLAVVMTLSMITPVFAASYSDTKGNDYEAAIEHLSGLGVIAGYEDGSFKPEKVVTRAEMAKLLVVSLGLEQGASILEGTSMFNDTVGHWAVGFINVAAQYGLIKGDGDGNFRPDDTVNYAEAATMCLRALGYERVVEKAGQWPTNYLNKANELKLFEDLAAFTGTDGAVRGSVAQLMWNMVNTNMWVIKGENETNGVNYGEGDTMLTLKFPYHTPVKLDVRTGAKYNVAIVDEDTIKIDGIEYDGVNPLDLFDGEVFEAIIYTKDNVREGKSLYINAEDENEETTAVVGRITKTEKGKVYVNGDAYKLEDGQEIDKSNVGKIVRLVVKNDKVNTKNSVNYLSVLFTKEIVVDTIKTDKNNDTTYKPYSGEPLVIREEDKVMYVSIDEKGDASFAKASDIKQGTIVSELNSKLFDGGRLIVISNEKVAGKLEKIEAGKIVINGTSYAVAEKILVKVGDNKEVASLALTDNGFTKYIGEEVSITVNYDNKALFMEADAKVIKANYGFITKVFTNSSAEEPVVRVKVVGLDGTATTYDAYDFDADKQVSEGAFTELLSDANDLTKTDDDVINLVQFELKDGKIDMSKDAGIKKATDTLKALSVNSEVNKTRKTVKEGKVTYVTTSDTAILNVGFDKDGKLVLNTVNFDDVEDELKSAKNRVIVAEKDEVKLDYIIIPSQITSDPNYAVVVSEGIALIEDNKYQATIYDVESDDIITVEVESDKNANVKGAVITYTKNASGVYTFAVAEVKGTAALGKDDKLFAEAGVGYTAINGTEIVVIDDVTVIMVDENGELITNAELSDIEKDYEIYVAEEVSKEDTSAKVIIVVEK